ncbi:phage integrase N-terminal SAM-like domain-containing protein [Clostridium swellfunianum]|uniref:phage integrase N-terminal SAM-like domain-containing protein n=1 Tax=Clostridium swellfunianum TaxID=1367462 RepID=UPI00202FA361|nr:phage integrase N-terminal SAM-like domain-containing protein [Clostridium swellfunianum]MCM0648425.1 phage integrase N-terminal SAM-like domain-containing protein [Clostridium swellfunianum]
MAAAKKKSVIKQQIIEENLTPVTNHLSPRLPVEFIIGKEGKKIIEEFKTDLEERNKALATIKSYIFDVNSFISFIESSGVIFTGEFNISQYKDFIEYQVKQKVKPSTINKRINSIQQFNIYLLTKKYMDGVVVIAKNDKLPVNQADEIILLSNKRF